MFYIALVGVKCGFVALTTNVKNTWFDPCNAYKSRKQ